MIAGSESTVHVCAIPREYTLTWKDVAKEVEEHGDRAGSQFPKDQIDQATIARPQQLIRIFHRMIRYSDPELEAKIFTHMHPYGEPCQGLTLMTGT